MPTKSWLVTVSVLVEQDEAVSDPECFGEDYVIWQAVTAAIADRYADQEGTVVEGQAMATQLLDSQPAVGRCAVCDRWVYDIENATKLTPRGVSRGAVVGGYYLCDEHLPPEHPHCFGQGYDGPVPPIG